MVLSRPQLLIWQLVASAGQTSMAPVPHTFEPAVVETEHPLGPLPMKFSGASPVQLFHVGAKPLRCATHSVAVHAWVPNAQRLPRLAKATDAGWPDARQACMAPSKSCVAAELLPHAQ